ncbi:hypothetical protein [Pseudomonas sp. 10S4]|uniref:hypothetical protein n=1 Tax=Pseudomonas sp. 10S4 TaxID=3048583 RepID=UPI002AC98839|nr:MULTISPECIES: hypothetical protein [unclassified Pseudomonas]MEB0224536.1 hypothetical protein [Pseudomonas sp. 5S1]MEB0296890.1 hypothetical protein [Pseudomonas sp. 10S4]WPX18796.1 hypothetical protein RHM58_01280 [Pseudomonas sp. 10S4]
MNEDEIRGRNLITDGRFSDNWSKNWPRLNNDGFVATYGDPGYGQYLALVIKATVGQTFETVNLTARQFEGATYKINFVYENYLSGAGSKVILKTSSGTVDEIDLSGRKVSEDTLADWNEFYDYPIAKAVADDRTISVELLGPSEQSESRALRITDIDVQLHLVPLKLASLQVDDRSYPVPA